MSKKERPQQVVRTYTQQDDRANVKVKVSFERVKRTREGQRFEYDMPGGDQMRGRMTDGASLVNENVVIEAEIESAGQTQTLVIGHREFQVLVAAVLKAVPRERTHDLIAAAPYVDMDL